MKTLVTFTLLAYSSLVFALDCENASTTPEIESCGKIELDKVELELNQVYNRVLKKMGEISKEPSNISDKSKLQKSFVEAQRLWVKFRKADCDTVYTFWSDGTIRGSMYLSCMMDRANNRIQELKRYEDNY